MKYIIGNWKAHHDHHQAKIWVDGFKILLQNDLVTLEKLKKNEAKIIVCPPYHLIPYLNELTNIIPNLYLGAQNISRYDEGPYTGEVTAKSLKDLVHFVIIGHSERRFNFQESSEEIAKKVEHCIHHHLEPIVCIRGPQDPVPQGVSLVAYEPVESIGTGLNAPLSQILDMKKKLNINPSQKYIYGGSVNEHNVSEYLRNNEIDGILPGTASLDPHHFYTLIKQLS